MFPTDRRRAGGYYRQPGEGLETVIAVIQRTRAALFVVYLVIYY